MESKLLFYVFKGLSLLPLAVIHSLGVVLGWLFLLIPNRERETARINIALCLPEFSASEQRRLLRSSLIENAKALLEMPAVWMGEPDSWVARFQPGEGAELPVEMLKRGKGLVVVAPHLGSWEVGVHYLARLAPVTALYRPPKNPTLEPLMIHGRGKGGASLVPTTAKGVKALYTALKRGEMITILPDQTPGHADRKSGVFAPFFGHPALTIVLINRLVRKTGAAVIYGYSERLPLARGYLSQFLPAPDGIADPDPERAAEALNKGVEDCVRRCPSQYQWPYKRFKSSPEGVSSPYRRMVG